MSLCLYRSPSPLPSKLKPPFTTPEGRRKTRRGCVRAHTLSRNRTRLWGAAFFSVPPKKTPNMRKRRKRARPLIAATPSAPSVYPNAQRHNEGAAPQPRPSVDGDVAIPRVCRVYTRRGRVANGFMIAPRLPNGDRRRYSFDVFFLFSPSPPHPFATHG